MRVVTFAGVEGAGKDTAAAMFCREWIHRGHPEPEVRAIADALRRACDEIGVPAPLTRALKGYASPEIRCHRGRDLLGRLGQVVADMLGPTWLLERVLEAHEDAHPRSDRVLVITDARRPEEVELLRQRGATVAWVERPGRSVDLLATTEVRDLCDHVVHNAGDLQHLGILVAALAAQVASRDLARRDP